MPKVGLKEILSLLAAGYKKKDIEAMIAAEEEEDQKAAEQSQAQTAAPEDNKAQEDADAKESTPEPDYKKLLEEKEKELKDIQEKLSKIQQDNIHENSAPAADEARKAEAETLTNLVRSFM